MTPTKEFLQHVKIRCIDLGVKLVLSRAEYVTTECGIQCNGFFDEQTLTVATGKPEAQWLRTLVHEYAHMQQWDENAPEWLDGTDPVDAENIVELWYNHEIDLSESQRSDWIGLGRHIELGAEKRAVKLIMKWNLPIDLDDYIRRANAYLYFWTYTAFSRRWYKIGKEPYNIPEIVSEMPGDLDANYNVLPLKLKKLFDKFC